MVKQAKIINRVGHSPHLTHSTKEEYYMRCVYPDTCIYYREIGKKNVRMVCDYRDGEEIKNILAEEIKNCKHYKTYKDVKWGI